MTLARYSVEAGSDTFPDQRELEIEPVDDGIETQNDANGSPSGVTISKTLDTQPQKRHEQPMNVTDLS